MKWCSLFPGKNHALLKSILITTPQHLQFLEDSLIWALVYGSITIFLESRRAQEKSACCNRCSVLSYRCDLTVYVYLQLKKLHYQTEGKKKSYLLTKPEEPWGALNRETMVFIYSLKRQPTLYCSLQNWTRPYKKPQIVSDLKKQFLQLAW